MYDTGEELEIRVLDLSLEGFTFRLLKEKQCRKIVKIRLNFFQFEAYRYQEYIPEKVEIFIENQVFRENQDKTFTENQMEISAEYEEEIQHIDTDYTTLYRVRIEDPTYEKYVQKLIKEYMDYVERKLSGDDAELAKVMAGYPAEAEKNISDSFEKQKKLWYANSSDMQSDFQMCDEKYQAGIALDRPKLWDKYLELEKAEFIRWYWECQNLQQHPFSQKEISYLYIGNQFCHLLFPEWEQLFFVFEKSQKENLIPVLTFTYMQESQISRIEALLEKISAWCTKRKYRIELVINDFGMLSMIEKKQYECFSLTFGVLLQKQKKDVRMKYKKGFDPNQNAVFLPSVNVDFYREYLKKKWKIERFSYEACGYFYEIPEEPSTLYLPYFQMNTGQHCITYALCTNGERGRQTSVENCPKYCNECAYLYPDMLKMVGKYNSLFGLDAEILWDQKKLWEFINQGVDRIVFDFI